MRVTVSEMIAPAIAEDAAVAALRASVTICLSSASSLSMRSSSALSRSSMTRSDSSTFLWRANRSSTLRTNAHRLLIAPSATNYATTGMRVVRSLDSSASIVLLGLGYLGIEAGDDQVNFSLHRLLFRRERRKRRITGLRTVHRHFSNLPGQFGKRERRRRLAFRSRRYCCRSRIAVPRRLRSLVVWWTLGHDEAPIGGKSSVGA